LYPASLQVSIARREGLAKTNANGFPASRHPTHLAFRSPSAVKARSVVDVCRPEALQSVSPCRISHKVPRLMSSLYPGFNSPKGSGDQLNEKLGCGRLPSRFLKNAERAAVVYYDA
jgi:hypothetical protein